MRIDLAGRSNKGKGRKRTTSFQHDVAIAIPKSGIKPGAKKARGRSPSGLQSSPKPPSQGSDIQAAGTVSGRPKRWRWLRRPLMLLALVAVVIAALYVSFAARFYVYSAEISGCQYLQKDEIYQTAGLDTQHILWIRPQRVEDLLAQVPGVKTAEVRRKMPAQVLIHIEERDPAIRWRVELDGKEYWLDEEGVVLPYQGPPQAILVTDTGRRHVEVGRQIEFEGIVPAVRQLTRYVPGIHSFSYNPDKGLSFVYSAPGGQWPVLVGDGRHLKEKVQAVLAVTDYFEKNGIQPVSVDVTRPRSPVYRRQPQQDGQGQ